MTSPLLPRNLRFTCAAIVFLLFTSAFTPLADARISSAIPDFRSTSWTWPIDASHTIIRPYIAPETAFSAGHRGIDIAAPVGAAVRSPADGIVHFSGFVVNRSLISIDHGGGLITSFEPVSSDLVEGATVQRGEPIGTLQIGHCRQSCLHVGVRLHGQYVSPMNFLGGQPPSVLLPTRELP